MAMWVSLVPWMTAKSAAGARNRGSTGNDSSGIAPPVRRAARWAARWAVIEEPAGPDVDAAGFPDAIADDVATARAAGVKQPGAENRAIVSVDLDG
jgi:hypothetical protein